MISSKCVCRVSLAGSKNALYFATMIPLLFWAFARNQSRLLSKPKPFSFYTWKRDNINFHLSSLSGFLYRERTPILKCFSISATIVDISVKHQVIKKIDNIFSALKKVSSNAIYLLLHPTWAFTWPLDEHSVWKSPKKSHLNLVKINHFWHF